MLQSYKIISVQDYQRGKIKFNEGGFYVQRSVPLNTHNTFATDCRIIFCPALKTKQN
jgi:hypothetical protein